MNANKAIIEERLNDGKMRTYSGFPFDLSRDDNIIRLPDIAHSLSMQCRYAGHTRRFYSVAEHVCLLFDYVTALNDAGLSPLGLYQNVDRLTLLHHDDAEYIVRDLPRPIKRLLPKYVELEERVERQIAGAFGTTYPFPDWLHTLDARILVDERQQAMGATDNWEIEPLHVTLQFWSPQQAKDEYMFRHVKVTAQMRHRAAGL